MKRGIRIAGATLLVVGLAAVLIVTMWSDGMASAADNPAAAGTAIPLAVLGDSNSHSYQDYVWFRPDSSERGGARRPSTFQWTEVLARTRGQELDLGPWVRWGRPGVVARAREWLGLLGGRAPKKEDYLYNFANSGAACKNLLRGRFRQAPRLVELMDQSPERWKRGVVVIRIGLNDWAGLLDLQSRNPAASESRAATEFCVGEMGAAMALIHSSHPATRILLVGIGNEADDPAQFERWQSSKEAANIETALKGFNGAIRQLAEGNPRVAYFDDQAWFQRHWGSRDSNGKPDYKVVEIGETLRVANTAGDDPRNALLEDHHAGLVWNALWAQALVARLREAFDLPLTPISDDEIERFLQPLVKSPRAPGS